MTDLSDADYTKMRDLTKHSMECRYCEQTIVQFLRANAQTGKSPSELILNMPNEVAQLGLCVKGREIMHVVPLQTENAAAIPAQELLVHALLSCRQCSNFLMFLRTLSPNQLSDLPTSVMDNGLCKVGRTITEVGGDALSSAMRIQK